MIVNRFLHRLRLTILGTSLCFVRGLVTGFGFLVFFNAGYVDMPAEIKTYGYLCVKSKQKHESRFTGCFDTGGAGEVRKCAQSRKYYTEVPP